MRILMVTNTYAPARNGVAAVVRMLRRELTACGHVVDVLTGTHHRRTREECVHEIPALRGHTSDYPWPMSGLGLPRTLKGREFDVVHVHHPVLLGPLGKALADRHARASVFTAHSVYTDYLDSYYRGYFRGMKPGVARRTARFLDGFGLVLAPSSHARRELRSWGVTAPLEMMEAAADITPVPREEARRRLGIEPGVPLALDVGRLAPEKRHDVVITEFALALALVPDARLVIIGEGRQRERLERLTEGLRISSRVRIVGGVERDDLADWYSAADVLAAGSLSETGPLTVVEAMTAGVPTVAYEAPGFEDRVATGDNGILVEPRDGELAAALASVLGNAQVRAKLSEGALANAAAYTPAKVTGSLLGYYEELLSSKKGR